MTRACTSDLGRKHCECGRADEDERTWTVKEKGVCQKLGWKRKHQADQSTSAGNPAAARARAEDVKKAEMRADEVVGGALALALATATAAALHMGVSE
jgi:hypothetical protein